jgi:hypothetical protein
VSKDTTAHSIDLEEDKVDFLKQVAATHGLADIGKAVRCLVNYAREHPERHSEIFDEVRCLDC